MFRNPLVDALVVLVVVLLFVGPKKLPQLGRGLGDGMREFKEGIDGDSKGDDHDQERMPPPDSKLSLKPVDEQPAPTAGREASEQRR